MIVDKRIETSLSVFLLYVSPGFLYPRYVSSTLEVHDQEEFIWEIKIYWERINDDDQRFSTSWIVIFILGKGNWTTDGLYFLEVKLNMLSLIND